MDLNGYLLEARGPAEPAEEQEALGRAARAMLQVRRRRAGSGDPTSGWRPRIAGRWTLVDAFSRRGQRFIVARENEAPAPGLEALTNREQQVVASAISGRSNKEIAYDLGISSNTARVLRPRLRETGRANQEGAAAPPHQGPPRRPPRAAAGRLALTSAGTAGSGS